MIPSDGRGPLANIPINLRTQTGREAYQKLPPKTEQSTALHILKNLNTLVQDAETEQQRLGIKAGSKEAASQKLKECGPYLLKALVQNTDISNRLDDIVSSSLPTYQGHRDRELSDIAYCLSLLPLAGTEGKKVSELLAKMNEISSFLSTEGDLGWKSDLDKIESLIKKAVRDDQLPKARSSLMDKKKIDIDDKGFAIIHAESVIKGTRFEGHSSTEIITLLKNYLMQNSLTYKNIAQLKEIIKMLRDAESLNYAASNSKLFLEHPKMLIDGMKERVESFRATLEPMIKNLHPGEKTLMDIGWVGTPSGHSMKLMIEREKEGTLKLSVFNAGAGIENHVWLNDHGEKLVLPFIEIGGVDAKRFLDTDYLQALLEFKSLRFNFASPENRLTEYGANDVYAFFLNALGGKVLPPRVEREKFITPQVAGTCTWSSLLAVLHTVLPIKDYYTIASGIAFDSLSVQYQKYQNQLASNEEARILFQHSLTNMAQLACDAYENGAITLSKLAEINESLKELKGALEKAEYEGQAAAIFNRELVFENYEKPLPSKAPMAILPTLDPVIPDSVQIMSKSTRPSTEAPFSFEWMDHPDALTGGLQYLSRYINNCISTGKTAEGIYQLEHFFALQAEQGRDDLWHDIPVKDIPKALLSLADLSELLCEAQNLYPERLRSYTVDAYYLAAQSLRLARKLPDLEVNGRGVNPASLSINFELWCGMYNKRVYPAPTKDTAFFNPEDRILRDSILNILAPLSEKEGGASIYFLRLLATGDKPKPIPDLSSEQPFADYELDYIDQFLKKHPLPDKTLSRNEAIAIAYNDWYGEKLPSAFCALRRQLIIANALHSEKPFKPTIGKLISTSHIDHHKKHYIQLDSTINIKKKEEEAPVTVINVKEAFKRGVPAADKEENEIFLKRREGQFSEADIMAMPYDEWERSLSLILAQGNADQADKYLQQQIVKGIAYFSDHFPLLSDPKKQMLLRQLIFESNYLELLLQRNPYFGKQVLEFANRGKEIFTERSDMAAAAFFIELGRTIDGILLSKGLKAESNNYRDEICKLLGIKDNQWHPSKNLTQGQLSYLYAQLAASYESHPPKDFDAKDAILLATALIQCNFHPLAENALSAHLKCQMQRAGLKWQPNIQKIIQGKNGNAVLSIVLSAFIPGTGAETFNCTDRYPLCVSTDKRYSLNMRSFELFEGTIALTGLPQNIVQDENFRKIFKQEKYACNRLNDNCYEFIDERERKIQILTTGRDSSSFKIRQLTLGMWYEMADVNTLQIPKETLPQDFETLCKEQKVWIPLIKEDKPVVLICNDDLEIKYFINLNASGKMETYTNNELNEVRKIKQSELPLTLVKLKGIKNKALEELLKTAMLWRDNEGTLKELEMPSLKLSFTLNKDNKTYRADCLEHPGYFVSSNQSYRDLQYIKKGVVLENSKGKRKLVLPYGTVTPEGGALNSGFSIREGDSIVFDLDKHSRPIPKDREQKLYLANLGLVQKKYAKAQALLRHSHTLLTPPSKKEQELLLQIIINQENDSSPHGMAVAATALALLPNKVTDEIEETLSTHMDRLLKEISKFNATKLTIPNLQLTEEEITAIMAKKPGILPSSQALSSETLQFPSVKKQKDKHPFSFERTFKSNLMGELKNIDDFLITRHTEPQFMNWLSYALTDPPKLELMLIGAEHNPHIPREITTLLRSVSHGFKLEPQLFRATLDNKNQKAFLALVKQAEKFESEWQAKQPSDKKEIALKGTRAKRNIRSLEKQKITVHKGEVKPLQPAPLRERQPLIPKKELGKMFTSIPNTGIQLSKKDIDDLKMAVLANETAENKALAIHIETYWTSNTLQEPHHYLLPNKLETAHTELQIQSAELAKLGNVKEQELIAFANRLLPQKQILFAAEKMGQIREEITIKDLILFTARSRHFTLKGKNPTLESKEKELLDRCLEFLELKAEKQQADRAIAIIEKLRPISDKKSAVYNRLSEALYTEVNRTPLYKAHENPELLVFEALEGIGLHDWQVKDLKRMLSPKKNENPNVILEKVMGSGKTKVYLPLLALSKADGDSLSIVVVHSSQYEEVGKAMQIKGEDFFAQVAHPFNFSRESDTSLPALKALLLDCEKVRKERHFFVATDKSIHSFGLAFDEMWHNYLSSDTENPELAERIEVMREIVNLFRTKGKATLDEADLLLNCRYEVVHAIGDAKSLSTDHAAIVADLYKSISPLLEQLNPYTDSFYTEIKPSMINAFVKEVAMKVISKGNAEKIISYLKEEKAGAEYVSHLPEQDRDLLAIALYEFKELLPLVLEKRCGEHYGYSDNPKKPLPVPYVASGFPSPTSEFSFPYSQLNYTMQTLIHEGVTPHVLKSVITALQIRAERERKMNPLLSLKETAAFKEFSELCGLVHDVPFLEYSEKDIARLTESYRNDSKKIYPFANKYLFPFVTMHETKLTSTPYTMCNMFAEVQGFTGTPYNSATYPLRCETVRDPNSAGKTQGIIWKNSQIVHNITSSTFAETMQEIGLRLSLGGYAAFIDVGAIFNGIDNQKAAENFLNLLPKDSFQGVLFFKDNRPYVLERGKTELIPFEKYDSTQSLFIFYDQYHTTGTDFAINGKSLLSFGKNTPMRDLEQGYMRDREAATGNRVEFILSPESQAYCRSVLNLPENAKIDTGHILRVAALNQDAEVRMQKEMGTYGRLKETLHKQLQVWLADPEIPPKDIRQYAREIDDLLVDSVQDNPWEQLGVVQDEKDKKETSDYFNEVINQMSLKVRPFFKFFYENPVEAENDLKFALNKGVNLDHLPKKMSATSKSRPDQQSVTLVEQEQASLVQRERVSDLSAETKSGAVHWIWDRTTNLSESSYYRTMLPRQFGMDFINSPIEHFSKNQAPFLPLASLIDLQPELREFKDLFDIEASYNFHPFMGTKKADNAVAHKKLFEKGQLDVQNMLLCKNKKTGREQLRLISETDKSFFFENLTKQVKDAYDIDPVMEVTLYNLTLGVLQSNDRAIQSGEKDPIDDVFRKKIVQAKFFNGECFYSPKELPLLQEWMKEKGPARMEKLFIEHIIKDKKSKRDSYSGSPLSELFKSLR